MKQIWIYWKKEAIRDKEVTIISNVLGAVVIPMFFPACSCGEHKEGVGHKEGRVVESLLISLQEPWCHRCNGADPDCLGTMTPSCRYEDVERYYITDSEAKPN